MALFVTSLNSGSNGNCYYIGNQHEAVLVDAGISCREIEKRLHRLQLEIQKIKAIFISHEHSDHIRGVEVLSRKYKIPVYITSKTYGNCGFVVAEELLFSFVPHCEIKIGSLSVTAFLKNHDAIDPYSFRISCNDIHVGVFTDIGSTCTELIKNFRLCHAAFLESNYDESMLANGNYPYHLKQRISGGKGHLSNREALELFVAHKPPFMTHLWLSHLSKNNNSPEIVEQLFSPYAKNLHISVASRYNEIPVFEIGVNSDVENRFSRKQMVQGQLFFD